MRRKVDMHVASPLNWEGALLQGLSEDPSPPVAADAKIAFCGSAPPVDLTASRLGEPMEEAEGGTVRESGPSGAPDLSPFLP